ncbi:MAG: sugar ABC transporter permease [Candidatus Wallbacteria bacterium]|nr:sugar ABC transporter permease [Candidatus Wallbacteria bacterium]MBI4868696.1 sugar ABC transporter permease [Candidatus Wallbacteria bacterium]
MSKSLRETLVAYAFLAPFLVVFLLFLGYPVLYSFSLSLHKTTLTTNWYDVFGDMRYCGLENYKKLLTQDVEFWHSLVSTGIYAALCIPTGIAVSLALALLMNNQLPAVSLFRSAFFLPNVLDALVVGMIWVLIYSPTYGLLDQVSNWAGMQLLPREGLLGNPYSLLPAIAVAMVLKGAGFGMVLLLTALQNIPESLYEAAEIDGCTRWQQLRFVTLPLLKPIFFFMTVTGLMGALNAFTEIYAMTGGIGGPSTTFLDSTVRAGNLVGFFLFTHFQRGNYGYASAISFVLLALALIFTTMQMKLLKAED